MSHQKSPLKATPLRQPGQSIQDEINDLVDDKMTPWLVISIAFLMITCLEWYKAIAQIPPHPIINSIFTVVLISFTVFKIVSVRKKLTKLKLAREGEKAVGQFLENLRAEGHFVFHDIIGDNFNLDHVIIGPKGVFTIETKTCKNGSGLIS